MCRLKYAQKARTNLLAWAQGNKDAVGRRRAGRPRPAPVLRRLLVRLRLRLTFDSGVYSDADRGAITAYFRKMADALQMQRV